MWKITKYNPEFDDGDPLHMSCNYDDSKDHKLVYKFRLLDDDDNIYCYGLSSSNDDENAFSPLDDFGLGMFGCTSIQYYNNGVWEAL